MPASLTVLLRRKSNSSRSLPGTWHSASARCAIGRSGRKAELESAHLASFPERNPNPVIELDAAGGIIYMNPAAKKLFPDLPTEGVRHPFLAGWREFTENSGRKTGIT